MNHRRIWTRIFTVSGYLALLVGAIDLLDGAIAVLLGGGLVALGTVTGQAGRGQITYRFCVAGLIALGVGALWALSRAGGIGGASGHSPCWGLLVLPYVAGWSLGVWGPGSPRWVLWLGSCLSLWFLALAFVFLRDGKDLAEWLASPAAVLALLGFITLAGCIFRLRKISR